LNVSQISWFFIKLSDSFTCCSINNGLYIFFVILNGLFSLQVCYYMDGGLVEQLLKDETIILLNYWCKPPHRKKTYNNIINFVFIMNTFMNNIFFQFRMKIISENFKMIDSSDMKEHVFECKYNFFILMFNFKQCIVFEWFVPAYCTWVHNHNYYKFLCTERYK